MSITILGIESSCDDTSASIVKDGVLLSNVTANQDVHKKYGGVVPELASRAHQQNIVPVVDLAIKNAGVEINNISAIAFTQSPGLLGSLLVGTSFSKGFALSLNIPLIAINHLYAHVLVHFMQEKDKQNKIPEFPFLCLLISGGHTQILIVNSYNNMEIIGNTIDDAAGEAFDKCGKVMGLDYPAGPIIDNLAKQGNTTAFKFAKPRIANLDFSFSGLKTSFLYSIRDNIINNPDFITQNMNDLCASLQNTIVEILIDKIKTAVKQTNIKRIAISGGVSANSHLRTILTNESIKNNWEVFIPEIKYTTDNAAMVAISGYYKYLAGDFSNLEVTASARIK